MKIHTTNYANTFIEVAEDCPVSHGTVPPLKDKPSVAYLQYSILVNNPYRFTSDDVLFAIFVDRNNIPEGERSELRVQFFSKGQPCFRASPLSKNYGWGVHSNEQGMIALYGLETVEYRDYTTDPLIKKLKAMRSVRR